MSRAVATRSALLEAHGEAAVGIDDCPLLRAYRDDGVRELDDRGTGDRRPGRERRAVVDRRLPSATELAPVDSTGAGCDGRFPGMGHDEAGAIGAGLPDGDPQGGEHDAGGAVAG